MPFVTPHDIAGRSFDYVVVGGGTTGLSLALKLSEDSTRSVLVLEAGEPLPNDDLINHPNRQAFIMGNPQYDWTHQVVPQKGLNNRPMFWNRGKVLGGSSATNFLCWSIPDKEDINDWERLGNEGWNWDTYSKAVRKSTTWTSRNVTSPGCSHPDKWIYTSGEGDIHVSFPKVSLAIERTFQKTLLDLGFPEAKDPLDGNHSGVSFIPNAVDPVKNTRSYIGTVFENKYKNRENISVLTSAYAAKVLFDEEAGELVASGVKFFHGSDNTEHVAKATKEVILSAGALKTPQILELSGIGRPEVLEKIGVSVKLDLPVGENIQEHYFCGPSYEIKDEVVAETFDFMRNEEEAAKHIKLFDQSQGIFNMGITNFLYTPLNKISSRADEINKQAIESIQAKIQEGKYHPGAVASLEMQIKKIQRNAPDREIVFYPGFFSAPNPPTPGKRYVSLLSFTNYSWSRGTIHCVSSDPRVDPAFDPRYFEDEADLDSLVESIKFTRSLVHKKPLSDLLGDPYVEVNPGPEVQTDDQLRDWIKQTLISTWHTAGSASMLPKEKGGVVDNHLKVYGTKNLRVADLSILPSHISGHTQATAYAIAEIASNLIRSSA